SSTTGRRSNGSRPPVCMTTPPLSGRNALVTGGAVRLGRALAIGLARAGANVCVHYSSSAEAARDTVAEVTAFGVRGLAIQADLMDRPADAARHLMREAS